MLETFRAGDSGLGVYGCQRGMFPNGGESGRQDFHLWRLAIVGGGHICGGLLEAGLIDEVSIMVAPGIDGRKGQTAVFDGIADTGCNPFRLKLKSMERLSKDIVWLRYTMEK